MRDEFKNWMLVVAIITVSGIIGYFALPNKRGQVDKEVLGTQSIDHTSAPYIVSIPPVSTKVNSQFEYEVEVSDLDTKESQLLISLKQKPSWMYLSDDMVLGVPDEIGTYKYVVSVSDGINSTTQVNYLLVNENE